MAIQTEFSFMLPRGYIDSNGQVHRECTIRLATALDEMEALQNPFVQADETYLPVVLLSRVITRLGELPAITPQILEQLFASDLAYLEDIYLRLNNPWPVGVETVCPSCSQRFETFLFPMPSESSEA